ncbi:MAG: DEAD/DEAH box helicase [Candidatus Aminicenantes bacterium]|nr:DEAD/DEAH box helicase [Candidatus Aminicenantes bacterium]
MKNHIKISVRNLVEFLLRSGDLSHVFDLSNRSPLAGIRGHQKIQRSKPESYHEEVAVSCRIEEDNFILDIQGRIDGIYELEEKIVLEEIKTTNRELEAFMSEEASLHWAQLKTYAAIYASDHKLPAITGQLTYLQVSTGEIKTIFQDFDSGELNIFLLDLAAQYLEWMEKVQVWQHSRNQSIATADFPYAGFRKGQQQMIDDVYETITTQGQLIIQAPTGIGKTVAVLYPAIQSLADGHIQKIFYLTARGTGRVIAEKTLEELKAKGLRIKYVTLTAKEKVCLSSEKNCIGDECPYARGYYDRLRSALDVLFTCDAFTQDVIAVIAQEHQICPFELSLDISLWMDCIICDLNYAFDPRVYLKRYFLESSLDCLFLIDEAHNLVDRSREMFSAQIQKSHFLELRRLLKNHSPKIYKQAGKINTALLEKKRELMPEKQSWETEKPETLLSLLRGLTLSIESGFKNEIKADLKQRVLDFYFEASWFLRVADLYDDNYSTCYEIGERDLRIKLFCIDPADHLHLALERARSAVLFSATMSPMSYFAQVLGCREDVVQRTLPSPFPSENRCLLVDPNISTYYRSRSFTKEELVRTVGAMISAKKGNYLVFFPSYEYLRMVLPYYQKAFPEQDLLVQTPGMGEMERIVFLNNFSHQNSRTLVGFVVMGGIFGEGIDLAGDRLSGAVIVGVGLPGISLERELIRQHFEDTDIPGFNYAYLYPGLNRVFQAAGRVIRSESDRGAILLIDTRYARPQYGSLLPEDWVTQMISSREDMCQSLDRFWRFF